MIHVLATIQIKPGSMPDFLREFHAIVPTVLKEKGCLAYAPTRDVDLNIDVQLLDENAVTIVEQWESVEDLQAHLIAPHMTPYREKVKDIVVGTSLKVLTPA